MFVRISKYDRSLIKVQKSLDKYYCIDNGMRGAVLMPQSNDNGKNLENTVFMQLNRMRESCHCHERRRKYVCQRRQGNQGDTCMEMDVAMK